MCFRSSLYEETMFGLQYADEQVIKCVIYENVPNEPKGGETTLTL